MAMDFSKLGTQQVVGETNTPNAREDVMVIEQYDIVADRQRMNELLVNSQEVDDLVSTIELDNLETIVSFGAKAAEEIAKASDVVLNSMNMSQLDGSTEMLKVLSNIMSKFDIEEIKEEPSFFG